MEVVVQPNPSAVALFAAQRIASLVRVRPDCVLGLATGSTMVPLYRELGRMHREEGLDFSKVTTFNLDEYIGLDGTNPFSFRAFMKREFFEPVKINPFLIHFPDGHAVDLDGECANYEKAIRRAGGIDLQIMGLGRNGHIGFNEPGGPLTSRTHVCELAPQTIQDNAVHFGDAAKVPRHCITMGVGSILNAKSCLLLAFGEAKADAVVGMLEGPMTPHCPASALQAHEDATAVLDEAAAGKISVAQRR